MNVCSQAQPAQCGPFGWLLVLVTMAPVRIDTGERERIKDFKRAYLAMSLTAMLLVYVFLPLCPSALTPSLLPFSPSSLSLSLCF